MLPEVFLLPLRDSTTLFVADLDDVREYLIKLLNVLIGSFLIRERDIKERMHDISTQIDEHFRVELNRLIVVLVTLVKHSTCFLCALFFADSQAFIDGEVTPRHIVDNLGAILLVAEYLDKLEKQVDELLAGPIAIDHATVFALLNNPLLIL